MKKSSRNFATLHVRLERPSLLIRGLYFCERWICWLVQQTIHSRMIWGRLFVGGAWLFFCCQFEFLLSVRRPKNIGYTANRQKQTKFIRLLWPNGRKECVKINLRQGFPGNNSDSSHYQLTESVCRWEVGEARISEGKGRQKTTKRLGCGRPNSWTQSCN